MQRMAMLGRAATVLLLVGACSSEPAGPGDPTDVWFVAVHGRALTSDGTPVSDAFVHTTWYDDEECARDLVDDETMLTDAEGRFSILLRGHFRRGCLFVSVTPEPGSGLTFWSYTAVQVDELFTNGIESNFTLDWELPPSTSVGQN